MPQIAPIADVVMQGAGYQRPNPRGDEPNYPTAEQTAAKNIKAPYSQGQPVQQKAGPSSPPVPQQAGTGQQGIETQRTTDNFES